MEEQHEKDDQTVHLHFIPETTTWHKGFRTHQEEHYVTDTGGIVTFLEVSQARKELYSAVSLFLKEQSRR